MSKPIREATPLGFLQKTYLLIRVGVLLALPLAPVPLFASSADEEAIFAEDSVEAQFVKSIYKIKVPDLEGTVVIDGYLSEPFWTHAVRVELTHETYPAFLGPSPVETEAYLTRLNDDLIVGFIAHDPNPNEIQAPLRDRDGIERDDYVGIAFDPSGKRIVTYEFYVSASGVQSDWIRNRVDEKRVRDWDADWESEAVISTNGYSVEMRIPISELEIPTDLEDIKRILVFKRHYPRDVRRHLAAFSTIIPRDDMRDLPRQLTLVPSITFLNERERDLAEGTGWESMEDTDLSLDLGYKLTSSFGLQATLNPTYLEVEADLTKSSINDPFSTLVAEKRPFFIGGLDPFGTLFDLVYTRNIETPRVGVKAGGSIEHVTLGNFFVDDRQLRVIVPGNLSSKSETLDLKSTSGALRYRYDFKQDFTLGVLSTVRYGESNYRNVLVGPDLYWKAGRDHEFRAQWVYSETQYPHDLFEELCDGDDCASPSEDSGIPGESAFNEQVLRADPDETYRDDALSLKYKFRRRGGYLTGLYRDVGEDFRGDLGYMPRVDFRMGSISGGLDHYLATKDRGQVRFRLSGNLMRMESQAGESINDSREIWLHHWGLFQSWVRIGYRDRDRVAKRFLQNTLQIEGNAPEFNEDQFIFRLESAPLRNGRLVLEGRFGEQIDTDNYRLGDLIEFEPEFLWNVNENFEISLKNTFRELEADGERVFTENYLTMNLTVQVLKDSFVRFTLIDDFTKRNLENYLFGEEDRLERDVSGELPARDHPEFSQDGNWATARWEDPENVFVLIGITDVKKLAALF